jgi:hypothetical protein
MKLLERTSLKDIFSAINLCIYFVTTKKGTPTFISEKRHCQNHLKQKPSPKFGEGQNIPYYF